MSSIIKKSNTPGIKEELHYFTGYDDRPSLIVLYNNDGVAIEEIRHQGVGFNSVYHTSKIYYDVEHKTYFTVKIKNNEVIFKSDISLVTKSVGLHNYSNNNKGCPTGCAGQIK